MALFDFMNKAQSKLDNLQKKTEELTAQLGKDPTGAITQMLKPKAKQSKPVTKQSKPDKTAEGITKQILEARDNLIKNGYKHYEFMANRGCCEACAALNGKHFPISKMKIGVNAPPMHDGCRCSIAAWEDDKEFEAWLNSL